MRTRAKRGLRPDVEAVEDRCLLSLATIEVLNQSTYNVTFSFRWSPSASWTKVTEAPGAGQLFWNTYSTSYQPQANYNTTTSSSSQTTVNLAQGYNQWFGTGTPPASACKLYAFQNTSTGIALNNVTQTPEDAVLEITNSSTYNLTFGFRWNPSAAWSTYTVAPGHYQYFWNTYSNSYAPQAQYNTTASSGSQTTVNLTQGYNQWFGTGTPPVSAARPYVFQNTTTGVTLYYQSPTTASSPATAPAWSGYVAETSLTSPQANSVSYVAGSWIVPTVSGPSTGTTDSSIWVGIDGWNGNTVEQLGTEEDVVNGKPVYDAWWEMYSSVTKQPEQIITGMTVTPGDSITASVQYISSGTYAGQFYLSIADNTRNEFFNIYEKSSATQNPQAQRTTAEWIVEAPTNSSNNVVDKLANFGIVNFTNASAVINGVSGPINSSSWKSTAIKVVQSGVTYDTTSVLGNSGSSFYVTYSATSGSSMLAETSLDAKTQSGTAIIGTVTPSGKKTGSPVVSGPSWNGASVVSSFRSPIRQLKRLPQGFMLEPLLN